jgi:hypothetical protein
VRWLERYLAESEPRLKRFVEVASELARKPLRLARREPVSWKVSSSPRNSFEARLFA